MKAENGNAEFIFYGRIKVGITIFVGNHFPTGGEADERSVISAGIFLELVP